MFYCTVFGAVKAPMRDYTYQDIFHLPSEFEGCQEKDRIEWESVKLEPLGFSNRGQYAR